MSKVYHIGDLHLGHRNILKYREEFSSIEEHNGTIVDNIKSTINKRDTLWLHGDILFSDDDKTLLDFYEVVSHCENIRWILGNHDTDNTKRQKLMMTIFKVLSEGCNFQVHSLVKYKGSWLSHAPLHPDELRGKINIHGHVHSQSIDDNKYFNVSCENVGYKPVTYQEILERI